MTETEVLQMALEASKQLGQWVVFLWLYLAEKRAHQETREQCRQDKQLLSIRNSATGNVATD